MTDPRTGLLMPRQVDILRAVSSIVPWTLCALLMCGCGSSSRVVARDDADPWRPPTDGPVELSLEALGGGAFDLADLRGRPVLVNYFATWCVPCVNELPRLDELLPDVDQAPGRLAVVGVSLDTGPRRDLEAFVRAMRLRLTVAMADADTLRGETPFGPLPAVPTSYLLDAAGHPVERFRGVVPIGYLKRRVAALGAKRRR